MEPFNAMAGWGAFWPGTGKVAGEEASEGGENLKRFLPSHAALKLHTPEATAQHVERKTLAIARQALLHLRCDFRRRRASCQNLTQLIHS